MDEAIAALRRFNRFYTRHVGALDAQFLRSGLTLVEARVLYEIATRAPVAASTVAAELGLDPGYLSRIVRRFADKGWISRAPGSDARQRPIEPTPEGRSLLAALDTRQRAAVAAQVERLAAPDADDLARALDTIRCRLGDSPGPVTIRDFRDGDMGRIVAAQARYYREAHGWAGGMEALMLDVAGNFLRDHAPRRSNCWVAERDGALMGSVFVVDAGDDVAQLRLLHVEAAARGAGVGSALIARCVDLARAAGYREIMLWTHAVLLPARRLYAAAGFTLRSTEIHDEFGVPETGETWALALR